MLTIIVIITKQKTLGGHLAQNNFIKTVTSLIFCIPVATTIDFMVNYLGIEV